MRALFTAALAAACAAAPAAAPPALPRAAAPSADTLLVQAHVAAHANETFRAPSGFLKHPYVVPAGPYNELWDWDSMFLSVALLEYGSAPYFVGSFLNFLDATNLTSGDLPGCLTPAGPSKTLYHAKPLIIQGALLAGRAAGDVAQFASRAPAMRALLAYWQSPARRDALTGLPRWHDQLESGADNNVFSECASAFSPCWVPSNALSLAAVDGAVWLARELAAYAAFVAAWRGLGARGGGAPDFLFAADAAGEAAGARAAAAALRDALNAQLLACDGARGCWYGALNATTRAPVRARTWAAALPVWAGLAPNASAEAAVVASAARADLSSRFGLRSTSREDPRYNNVNMINPYSNWQGPVWINGGYLFALAARRAGNTAVAAAQADALVATLANDLRATGTWHESYDAESGAGLAAPEFLSWNTLGGRVQADVAAGIDPFSID